MKKSLIALAIASAVSAPAFAATANVDIYGVLNMSMNFFDNQLEGTVDGSKVGGADWQFSSNASRIGFKGAEDLGGGLTAIWQIESTVNLDEGKNGNTFATRNSFVGLKGNFGTALIGRHDTPFKLVGRAVDLFGDTIADSRNLMGFSTSAFKIAGEEFDLATSDMRADNVVAYISPNWTGFSFAAAYSTDPVSSNSSAPDQIDMSVYSLNATYTNGGLYLGGAYSDGDALEALGQDDNWRLAAGFTFGAFKIVGQYDQYNADDTNTVLDLDDYSAWMVGGAWTMGNFVFKGNYISGEFDGADNTELEQWALGADYNLSKRTSVYALYVDGQNAALGWGAGASDVNLPNYLDGNNEDIAAISVGVKHSF